MEGFSKGNGRVFWGLGGVERLERRPDEPVDRRPLDLLDIDLRITGEVGLLCSAAVSGSDEHGP